MLLGFGCRLQPVLVEVGARGCTDNPMVAVVNKINTFIPSLTEFIVRLNTVVRVMADYTETGKRGIELQERQVKSSIKVERLGGADFSCL
jgi:hypothetical protein